MKNITRWLPLTLFIVLALMLWRGLFLEPSLIPSAKIGQKIPDFSLPSLGHSGKKISNNDLPKRWLLVNVWASWCAACMDEQLFLLKLAKEGVPIIGVNYKDNSQQALAWLDEWGNPYRLIAEDRQGKLAMDLGVYGAPETFLLDKEGYIVDRHVGVLNESTWRKVFMPKIQGIEASS